MFKLGIVIGIYSYIVLGLGFLSFLTKTNLIALTLITFLFSFFIFRKTKLNLAFNRKSIFLINLLIIQVLVNLIGALGPELGFDALWYHLTLPKIYLENSSVFFIPGNLFYYSTMPKLAEMLYVSAIALQGEALAKLIHFFFGILCLLMVYKISRKFLNKEYSLLSAVIFSSNLVFNWLMITAYIDLVRTFFEITAVYYFISWFKSEKLSILTKSSIMLGLSISSKLIVLSSVPIFLLTILFVSFNKKKLYLRELILFSVVTLLIPTPWFIFSYLSTSNPFYPFFSGVASFFPIVLDLNLVKKIYEILLYSPDPVSPIYLILFPLLIIYRKNKKNSTSFLLFYSFSGFIIWYLVDLLIGGGSRFFLPFMATSSVLASFLISILSKKLNQICIAVVLIISITSIGYRFIANYKYIPVLIGVKENGEFLRENLNFNFGDFYDTDSYFKKNLTDKDNVLLFGFHNLYYVDFNYIDSSYVKKGDCFNMIAVQDAKLPSKYQYFKMIYENKETNVVLYEHSKKVCL